MVIGDLRPPHRRRRKSSPDLTYADRWKTRVTVPDLPLESRPAARSPTLEAF
jgi:hypothetical protein